MVADPGDGGENESIFSQGRKVDRRRTKMRGRQIKTKKDLEKEAKRRMAEESRNGRIAGIEGMEKDQRSLNKSMSRYGSRRVHEKVVSIILDETEPIHDNVDRAMTWILTKIDWKKSEKEA